MRLIDADALEELFREVIGNIAKRPEIGKDLEHMVRASAMAVQMIQDAPTVGGWISVKDKLPEESGKVLVYCKDGYMSAVNYSAKHQQFNNFDACAKRDEVWDVTHWMPLPEPPEEKANE